jgi:uncharacterized protein (TIGR03083 family)
MPGNVPRFTRRRRAAGAYAPATPNPCEATVAARPLRQYYASDGVVPVPVSVGPDLGDTVGSWRRHRARFLDAVRSLDAGDWEHATRCDDWSAREVVAHLVTVDGFWPVAKAAARDGGPPTTYLAGFDPSSSPDEFVRATTATASNDELLERHADALAALDAFVTSLDDDAWDRRCESPLGHVPARIILAHGYWDSWLHEYDIFVPLGDPPAVERDDLLAATWFSLVMAGLQGGLVGDPDAVGPGPDAPIDVCLAFTDLPGEPLHFSVGALAEGVTVTRCAPGHPAVDAGRAVDLVEGLTGRQDPEAATGALPPDVAAQVRRAALIF